MGSKTLAIVLVFVLGLGILSAAGALIEQGVRPLASAVVGPTCFTVSPFAAAACFPPAKAVSKYGLPMALGKKAML